MAMNASQIIPSLKMIMTQAWDFNTMVTGGFWGLIIIGVKRAMFSNEAGLGSAPMYHGQSKTDNPIKEGLVASLGPFIDTILVCTFTAKNLIDLSYALMVIPNMIAVLLLAPKVNAEAKKYFKKLKDGRA